MTRFFLFCSVFLFAQSASAGPIYVFKQKDGTIKFTSEPPPAGITAKVFTARKGTYSLYRIQPHYGGPSYVKRNKNQFNQVISQVAGSRGVDGALIKAVIHVESGFNPRAVSPKGARGLMQLMPGTARDLGVRDSFSPLENIDGGTRYLAMMLRKYNGNLQKALAAYNAGPDAVDKYGGIPPYAETQNYVRSVLYMKKVYGSPN